MWTAPIKVAMVGVKRKLASTVTDEEPANKLRKTQKKTRQGSRTASKEQKLAMFKKPMPIIPLESRPPVGLAIHAILRG